MSCSAIACFFHPCNCRGVRCRCPFVSRVSNRLHLIRTSGEPCATEAPHTERPAVQSRTTNHSNESTMSLLPGGDPYIATLEVSAGFSWVLSVWFVAAAIAVNLRKNGAEHAAAGMLWSHPNHASLVAFASSPAQPNERSNLT